MTNFSRRRTAAPAATASLSCETLQQRWQACRMGITEQRVHPRASFARMQQLWEQAWRPIELHGIFHWEQRAARSQRPCCSRKRNQCRARGPSQMKPAPWNPSHGWFLMPLPGER